jgi:hypothetical protein
MTDSDPTKAKTRTPSPRISALLLRTYIIAGAVLTVLYGLLFLFIANFSALGGRHPALDTSALFTFLFGIYTLYWGTRGAGHGIVMKVMTILVSLGWGIYIYTPLWVFTILLVREFLLSLSVALILMTLTIYRARPQRQ